MNVFFKHFSERDKNLIQDLLKLCNDREYDLAIQKIKIRLESLSNCKKREDFYLKMELAGILIDIGEDGRLKQATLDGLQIYEKEKNKLKGILSKTSIEYNLGNAKSTLFKIEKAMEDFEYIPRNMTHLLESKNHYWRAYKIDFDERHVFKPQLVVNLANSLSNCGRIAESLQYYDLVLEKFPDFPQANASRAKELLWLKKLSGGFTKNLIYQAKVGYEKASKDNDIPKWLISDWKIRARQLNDSLKKLEFDEKNIHQEFTDTKKEFESLSKYRQFCINYHLALSEHSLYCNCIGSRRDDLLICTPYFSLDSEFIPMMEKILNRLKSEYSVARLFYYLSIIDIETDLTSYDSEVMFSELFDSEYLGSKAELLRTSFRLCFGILDKIANAICLMFDLADEKESIYFESFWKPNIKNASKKQKERWDKINSINNISLVALYSQATDLNNKTGEWGFFKDWRNTLEHKQFSLLCEDEIEGDIFNIYSESHYFKLVDKNYFRNKTLQLLQFTRSAIFNFVFLIRNEATKPQSEKKIYISHTITFKNDYDN